MKIELHKITVRELVEGYVDDAESGVKGFGGKLDIRPAYQREFVYGEKERNAVISTVMKGLPWGEFYNEFSEKSYSPAALEKEVAALMADREVQKKSGIYEYVLSGRTRPEKLNLRQFEDEEKREAYERQTAIAKKRGISNCPRCANGIGGMDATRIWAYEEMEADHIKPWSKGGRTVAENCQMLCADCNRRKGGK